MERKRGFSRILVIMLSIMMVFSMMDPSWMSAFAEDNESEVTAEQATEAPAEESAQETAAEQTKEEAPAENKEEAAPAEQVNETTEAPEAAEVKPEEKTEENYPAFSGSGRANGVTVTAKAKEGTFPEGARLVVRAATKSEEKHADKLVEDARSTEGEIAASYAFDISVVDKDGNEIQPKGDNNVRLSFKTSEVADSKLTTEVFHIADGGSAEKLNVSESGSTASVNVDGFSIYVIKFAEDGETVIDPVTVTYEFYNGTEKVQEQIIKAGDALRAPAVPDSTHKFKGWYVGEEKLNFDKDGMCTISTLPTTTDGKVRVDAKFGDFHYVTFYDQDDNVFSRIGVENGGSIAEADLPAFTPKQSNQQLVGWTETKGDTTAVTFPVGNISSDASYYPIVQETHVIHFDANRSSFPGMAADSNQGIPGVNVSYTAPQVVQPGEVTVRPSNPSASTDVYTFVGWYEDKDCKKAFTWGQTLTENKTLYAKWEVGTTSYQIVVWKEKATVKLGTDDRDNLHPAQYDYYKSYTVNDATVLGTASIPSNHESLTEVGNGFELATYSGNPSTATILPDGSTTLNVYWNRKIMSSNFYRFDEAQYNKNNQKQVYYWEPPTLRDTYIGLYGQSFEMYGKTWPTGVAVYSNTDTAPASEGKTLYCTSGSKTLYRGAFNESLEANYYEDPKRFEKEPDTGTMFFVKQNADGSWPNADWESVGAIMNASYLVNNLFTNYSYSAYNYGEYLENESNRKSIPSDRNIPGNAEATKRFVYYTRDKYDIEFHSSATTVSTIEVYYEGKPSESDIPSLTGNGHQRFAGWSYTDGDTNAKNAINFSTFKMPDYKIRLYPIWVSDAINVKLDLGATDAIMDSNQSRNFWPAVGSTIDMSYMNGATRPGYILDGWYTSNGNRRWTGADVVQFDACDDVAPVYDENYKNYAYTLTLKAKWTPSTKATLSYDLNGGSGTVADTSVYLINGKVKVSKDAPTAPEGKIFVGWKDRTGAMHLPGDTFAFDTNDLVETVEGKNVIKLTAVYTNPGAPKSSITYNANYPKGASNPGADTIVDTESDFNQMITLRDAHTFSCDGYVLTGWSQTADNTKDYDLGASVLVDDIANDTNDNELYGVWAAHTHNWSYETTNEGKTITATCNAAGHGEENSISVTITAPDETILKYNSLPKRATLDKQLTFNATTGQNVAIEYFSGETKLESAPVNAGTYTAKITAGGKTAQVEYTIRKNDEYNKDKLKNSQKPTANTGLQYDGEAQALVTAPTGDLPIGYSLLYSIDNGANWVSAENLTATNAGKYTVLVKYAGDNNHEDFNGDDISVTIDKKPLTDAMVSVTPAEVTFDKASHTPAVSVSDVVNNKDIIKSTDYSLSGNDAQTNAGTYTVTVTATNDGNYRGSVSKTWKINPASQSKNDLTAAQKATAKSGLVYNGNFQALVDAPAKSLEGYTIQYSLDGETWKSVVDITGKNAGSYTVQIKYVGDSNHNSFDGDSITVNIGKKTLTSDMVTVEPAEVTYDTNPHTPKVTVSDKNSAQTELIASGDYSVSGNGAQTNANTYTVTVTASENGNYSGTVNKTWKIKKASQDAVNESGITATATTNSITVTAPVKSNEDPTVYEYSIDGTNWQTTTVFAGLTAGTTYTVSVRKAATADYEASAPASKNVTTKAAKPDSKVEATATTLTIKNPDSLTQYEVKEKEGGKTVATVQVDKNGHMTVKSKAEGVTATQKAAAEGANGDIVIGGLTPEKKYTVTATKIGEDGNTIPETTSDPAEVTTGKKTAETTPASAPSATAQNDGSIKITGADDGNKYVITDANNKTWEVEKTGNKWTISPSTDGKPAVAEDNGALVVSGLANDAVYSIQQIKKSTDPDKTDSEASPATNVKTAKAAPTTPAEKEKATEGKNDGSIKGVDNTMEYRKSGDNTWTPVSGSEITGLEAGTYEVRYKEVAASGDTPKQPASSAKEVTVDTKGSNQTPVDVKDITATTTTNSITVTAPVTSETDTTVYEYRIGEGTWQKTTEFTGLNAGTTYTVSVRKTATASDVASDPTSKAFTTKPELPGSKIDKTATTITIKNPDSLTQYEVKEKEGGKTVATVQVDKDGKMTVKSTATGVTATQKAAAEGANGDIVISGLTPEKTYTVTATKIGEDGNIIPGATSDPVEVTTDQKTAETTPTISEVNSKSDSVEVKPATNGTNYIFKDDKGNETVIKIDKDGKVTVEPSGSNVKAKVDDGKLVVEGLTPNTSYDVTAVKPASDPDHTDSAPTESKKIITAKDAPTTPVQKDKVSAAGNDGSISGVDDTMEYRKSGDTSWTTVSGSEITGLAAGTYEVRYKGVEASGNTPEQPASEAKKVTVNDKDSQEAVSANDVKTTATDTSITVDSPVNKTGDDTKYEYSIDGGKSWQNDPTFSPLDPGKEYDVQVRKAGDDDKNPSDPVTVKVSTKAEKPVEISHNARNITVQAKAGTEYSADGGTTWVKAKAGENSVNLSGLKADTKYQITARAEGKPDTVSEALEVTTGSTGRYITRTDIGSGVPNVKVSGFDSKLAEAVCEDSEKEAVADGADAYLFLEITDIDKTVSNGEKNIAGDFFAKNYAGSVIGQFIDISLYKAFKDGARTQVHDTKGNKIGFKVAVPDSMKNRNANVERTFYMLRIHDGVPALLATTTGDEFNMTSDKFSTYVIAYSDKELKTADNGNAVNSGNKSDNSGNSGKSTGVRTGDSAMIYVWTGILVAAVMLLIFAVARRRRKEQE